MKEPNTACAHCKSPLYRKPSELKRYAHVFCNGTCYYLYQHLPIVERLMGKTVITEPKGCWEWQGATDSWGYGKMSVSGKLDRVHVISYRLNNGPIPAGLFVLHRCDNPPCWNPDHLFTGTAADNTADMVAKGRQKNGSNSLARRKNLA